MPNTNRPTISTHVLDTTRGEPAAGVSVTLSRLDGKPLPQRTRDTDSDGRIGDMTEAPLSAGMYRISFDVAGYYKKKGQTAPFLQQVTLDFEITDTSRRYHIPLLMSPFSCATYRGS